MKADKKIITAFIILAFILLVLNIASHAAEDSLKKAMEKYETHRYSEGIALLKKEIDGRQKDELVLPYFILGRFYLKEAELYRTMYETSLMTTNDYLIKLNSVRTGKKSKYLPYFMGLLYLETGQAKKAAATLQQFVNSNSVDTVLKEKARLKLGAAYYISGDRKKAEDIWAEVTAAGEDVIAEKGYVYARLNIKLKDAVEMAQNSINLSQKNGNKNHSKIYREIAFIYYKNDMSDAALGLMDKISLNEPEVLDNVEKNKVVRFYDPALLNDMSRIYYYAAGKYFNKVMSLRGREKYEDLIRFYLSEVNYRLNRYDDSINEINGFLKSNKLDAKYNKKINVLLGACYYKKGDKKKAIEIWDDLLNKNLQDDSAISALMDVYAELNVDATAVLKKIEGLAASKDEKKPKPFYNSLGLLYYSKKDYEKSVQALELVRDKANKNKIEANDPVFLIRLANSYYRLKKYSEALEIFFELGKDYPVVRQIQDTIQGVYSADEKGSGDVRIY
jgi:tetratricopeptide (TPR) repeat protein